jgi:epoxyqueuosine reductase
VIPPHYAGYYETPRRFAAAVEAALAPRGHRAAEARVPLKTAAAAAGLARYGINNVAYVEGLGSYVQLAACVTDAPPPAGAHFLEAQRLGRCGGCTACLHACPTGAVPGDRFVLHADRCLTAVNESEEPFPEWVDPAWHACAVGCLRCQQVCPENATVTLRVEPRSRRRWHPTRAPSSSPAGLTMRRPSSPATCARCYPREMPDEAAT